MSTKGLGESKLGSDIKKSSSGVPLISRQVLHLRDHQAMPNTAAQVVENICAISKEGVGVQGSYSNIGSLKGRDLIVHQGEQR